MDKIPLCKKSGLGLAVVASVVVLVVVASDVDENFVGIGASVVMDWAVSFISSTDAVAIDSRDPSVLTWTLFAASALIIEVSRSESRAPDPSVFSSEVLTLPHSEISCNSQNECDRFSDFLKVTQC